MEKYTLMSKRGVALPDVFQYTSFPSEFRHQVVFIWKRTIFSERYTGVAVANFMLEHVCEARGIPYLVKNSNDQIREAITGLLESEDPDIVLGLIELSCRAMYRFDFESDVVEQIEESIKLINYRFRQHGIGYQFEVEQNQLISLNSTFLVHRGTMSAGWQKGGNAGLI